MEDTTIKKGYKSRSKCFEDTFIIKKKEPYNGYLDLYCILQGVIADINH
jgi:hypothetical protein